MIMDVARTTDGAYLWMVRVFEDLGDDTYRLHAEDVPEAAFPAERIEASLLERFAARRRLRRRALPPVTGVGAAALRLSALDAGRCTARRSGGRLLVEVELLPRIVGLEHLERLPRVGVGLVLVLAPARA